MRKGKWFVLLMLGWMLCSVQLAVAAPAVMLDGQPLGFAVEPVIENDHTLVQIRPIFEALGASLQWDSATQTVTATSGGAVIQLTIDAPNAHINGTTVPLDVPARVINGSTMVPLRFV